MVVASGRAAGGNDDNDSLLVVSLIDHETTTESARKRGKISFMVVAKVKFVSDATMELCF